MLQYVNSAIDAVQGAKHQFLNTFVKEESLKKPWQAYVDTQTAFVKQAAKTAYDLGTAATASAKKFDFTELNKVWK